MNVLFIEPHPDDLLLSCPDLLYNENIHRLYILTFYGGDDRTNGAYRKISDKVRPITLPIDEIHYDKAETDYNSETSEFQLLNYVNLVYLYENMSDLIVCPVGIYHPHHLVVSNVGKWVNPSKLIRYLDRPYYDKLDKSEQQSFSDVLEVKHNLHISELMRKCFRPKYLTGFEHKIKSSLYLKGSANESLFTIFN